MHDFLPRSADLVAFSPEIALVLATLAVLLVLMFSARKNMLVVAIAAAAGLGIALLAVAYTWLGAIDEPGIYFGGLLVLDPFSWAIKLMLIGFACIVMALWFTDSHDKFITRGQAQDAPEPFAMLLSTTFGLCLMASTTNLLMMFVGMEMAAIPCYVLVGFRKGHKPAAEAAIKVLLLGGAVSAVMLYGMSLLYGLFGTLDIQMMGAAISDPGNSLGNGKSVVLALGVLGILAGVGFKIGMAPLHFWRADVFEGAGIDIAAFLSVAPLAAGLALLMRVLCALTGFTGATQSLAWLGAGMLVIGTITALWGSLGAYFQNDIKRLLAWSTMAHAGYMLIGLTAVLAPALASRADNAKLLTSPAAEGLLFYLFLFLFMNGGAFVTAAAIAQRLTGPADAGMSLGVDRVTPSTFPPGSPAAGTGEDIRQYAALSRRAPILAALMLVFLLSLAGAPLTIGFSARLKLFTVLLDTGNWLGWIGMGAIGVSSIICAFSYFRVIREMYFRESEAPRLIEIAPVTVVALVLLVPNVVLFVTYGWLDHEAHRHAGMIWPPTSPASPASADNVAGTVNSPLLP